ncbi:MAG TPA: biotin-dependent carboxyltransferase family protein [Oleiagrimonas sp.]|nr:biotin-dependent carboxyltransferase family protein [Oleiagrimonas sp.]
MLTIKQPGPLTTLQDLGRNGSAHLGIGHAGAADQPALRLANALVGNPASACALEATLLGPSLIFDHDVVVAVTGAPLSKARIGDQPLPPWQAVHVPSGTPLTLGPMAHGCRSYLAVAGGIDVPCWRQSRSTDINAGLGPIPRALEAGDTLPIGHTTSKLPADVDWSLDPRPWFQASTSHRIRLLPGSHAERLDAASRERLVNESFRIGNDSNRVGLRLEGPHLALDDALEMTSEGVVAGTMQLPPGGQPIIMGCEHPVTGGYPRIAHVCAVDLPVLAQCRPGDTVTFEWIDKAGAMELLATREDALEHLVDRIRERLEQA